MGEVGVSVLALGVVLGLCDLGGDVGEEGFGLGGLVVVDDFSFGVDDDDGSGYGIEDGEEFFVGESSFLDGAVEVSYELGVADGEGDVGGEGGGLFEVGISEGLFGGLAGDVEDSDGLFLGVEEGDDH